MFCEKYFPNYNIIFEILFPFFIQISKNAPDSGDGDGENFLIFFVFLTIFWKIKPNFLKKLHFYTIISTAKFYYRNVFFGNFP